MIIQGLVALVVLILQGIVYILPTWELPQIADLSAFKVIAWLVPINEIVTVSAAMGVFAVASLSYVAINWVVNKIRGSG
jgi:hypothetical protein